MITRILLAVDDSPAAMAAARHAIELAACLGARLHVVTVLSDHPLSDLVTRVASRPGVHERRDQAAGALLDHVVRLARVSEVDADARLLEGDVAHRILAEARSTHADLIVVGTSEGLDRSTSAHILEFAGQPVLIVPPEVR
ncbi:universal stress protein [Streptosporangium roseum]|uniref:universal stress protein n=1 Tax=Streptosporangium roseum TaxID=2001 RepID=UPI0004CD2ED1|nr:universal stress protein [Streptosporangium roseum]